MGLMTKINKECLARALAVFDGKETLFDQCMKSKHTERKYRYAEGYIQHATRLIKQYEKELKNHES